MLFISSQKLFSFSRYLSFCHDFLVMQEKRLNQKVKVNFKIHDVTTWFTNNCNTHIAQYFTKQGQQVNEIWSVNRKILRKNQQDKYFSSKIMEKMMQGDQFHTSFYFLEKLNMRLKQVVCSLASIYFDSLQLTIQ